MYRKRATLVTFNSLAGLPKVCSRYPISYYSVKTLTFLRNFGTATERLDFDSSSGVNNQDYVDYNQNPNGINGNDRERNCGLGGNWNFGGSKGNFRENQDGFYGGNETRVYGKNPNSERQQYPVGQNGVFANNINNYNNTFLNGFGKGFQQSPDGGNRNFRSKNEFQKSPVGQNVNFGSGSYENRQQHFDRRNGNEFQQSSFGRTMNFGNGGSIGPRQNLNESYARNPEDLQQSGYSGGNAEPAQQNAAASYNVGSLGNSNKTPQNYYHGGPGNFQHMQGNYSSGNAGMHHQTLNLGPKEDDVSTGNSEDMKLKGTIQELDDFLKEGKLEEVVTVLGLLEKQGVGVDLPRYLGLMKACGADRALEEAKSIHDHLLRSIPNLEVSTYNKILEMYCECGSMEDAHNVFHRMPQRNLTSWDTLITGLAKNGHGETSIELFTEFKELGLKPDGQMYLGVFYACSTLLDITEGMLHFKAMTRDYGIVPSMEHYVSVVDMLGSTGHLDEALEFIEKMPIQPSVEVWETLMNLSRIQGNLELGNRCAELVELLDPSRLHEQSRAGLIPLKASDLVKEKEKKKPDGQNPLEVRSRVHEYRAGDRSDPDHEKLYALLWGLKHQMKEAGYIPETKVVLHDIDQESKEEAVLGHSERLAVAKGFLNTPARSSMRVIKNLRVCIDCHNAMKIISKLVGRELIMRDAKRFHHFKDGVCSCRDYW